MCCAPQLQTECLAQTRVDRMTSKQLRGQLDCSRETHNGAAELFTPGISENSLTSMMVGVPSEFKLRVVILRSSSGFPP